ncbi:MAG: hypothetical protein IJN08_00425, partial [Clostridia bacterium]|nr:hypothetical protein [Clostridia bacterium]
MGEAESAVGNAASKPGELQLPCEWAASFSRKGKSTLKGRRVGIDKIFFNQLKKSRPSRGFFVSAYRSAYYYLLPHPTTL